MAPADPIERVFQLPLHRHRATPCTCASALSVRVQRTTGALLSLTYRIEGDVGSLRLPARQRSGHRDGLWRSTCFEAFVKAPGERCYVEVNVSPSTEWAMYRFDDYRTGMQAITPKQSPRIVCGKRENGLEADVEIDLASLALRLEGELMLGIAAVLEEQAGTLSYWALAHPARAPDFHHPGSFVVTLQRS